MFHKEKLFYNREEQQQAVTHLALAKILFFSNIICLHKNSEEWRVWRNALISFWIFHRKNKF